VDGSWSAPSAITISGVGWGFQLGAEVTDVMLLLTSDAAVDTFMSRGQVSVGAELGVSVGPVGRSIGSDVSAGDKGHSHAFSYAMSQGLFFGASLEATAIASRSDVNRNFYGEDVSATALLSGEYPKPKGGEPLYKALEQLLRVPEPSQAPRIVYEAASPKPAANVSSSASNEDSFLSAPSVRPAPPGRAASGKYAKYKNGDAIGLDSAEEFGLGGTSV
jgi:hypothetical protein